MFSGIKKLWFGGDRTTYFEKTADNNVRTVVNDVVQGNSLAYTNVAAAATSVTMSANDSGRILVVADLTSDCTFILPAPADGLNYEWLYNGTAADGQDWAIQCSTNGGDFEGGVVFHDADAGTGADSIVPVYSDATDNTLTVLTPEVGTTVKVVSNGTDWYLNGSVVSATVPTLTTV